MSDEMLKLADWLKQRHDDFATCPASNDPVIKQFCEKLGSWERMVRAAASAEPVAWREDAAKIIFDAFPFEPTIALPKKPLWVEGGNSLMQDAARRAADRIAALAKAKGGSQPCPHGVPSRERCSSCNSY